MVYSVDMQDFFKKKKPIKICFLSNTQRNDCAYISSLNSSSSLILEFHLHLTYLIDITFDTLILMLHNAINSRTIMIYNINTLVEGFEKFSRNAKKTQCILSGTICL